MLGEMSVLRAGAVEGVCTGREPESCAYGGSANTCRGKGREGSQELIVALEGLEGEHLFIDRSFKVFASSAWFEHK